MTEAVAVVIEEPTPVSVTALHGRPGDIGPIGPPGAPFEPTNPYTWTADQIIEANLNFQHLGDVHPRLTIGPDGSLIFGDGISPATVNGYEAYLGNGFYGGKALTLQQPGTPYYAMQVDGVGDVIYDVGGGGQVQMAINRRGVSVLTFGDWGNDSPDGHRAFIYADSLEFYPNVGANYPDFLIVPNASGQLRWGDGTNPSDTVLQRHAPGWLRLTQPGAVPYADVAYNEIGVSDDTISTYAFLNVGPGMTPMNFQIDDPAVASTMSGGTVNDFLFQIDGYGALLWGFVGGGGTQDTTLGRAGAGSVWVGDKDRALDGQLLGASGVQAYNTSLSAVAFYAASQADAVARWQMLHDGSMHWGDGINPPDTILERYVSGGRAGLFIPGSGLAGGGFRIDSTKGHIAVFDATDPGADAAAAFFGGHDASVPVVIAQGAPGQTADLQEWQDSTGALLGAVGALGVHSFKDGVWHGALDGTQRLHFATAGPTYYRAQAHHFQNDLGIDDLVVSGPDLQVTGDLLAANFVHSQSGTANAVIAGYDGFAANPGPAVSFGIAWDATLRRAAAGVIEIPQHGGGLMLTSPDGTKKARIGIDNTGALSVTAL